MHIYFLLTHTFARIYFSTCAYNFTHIFAPCANNFAHIYFLLALAHTHLRAYIFLLAHTNFVRTYILFLIHTNFVSYTYNFTHRNPIFASCTNNFAHIAQTILRIYIFYLRTHLRAYIFLLARTNIFLLAHTISRIYLLLAQTISHIYIFYLHLHIHIYAHIFFYLRTQISFVHIFCFLYTNFASYTHNFTHRKPIFSPCTNNFARIYFLLAHTHLRAYIFLLDHANFARTYILFLTLTNVHALKFSRAHDCYRAQKCF